MDLVIAIALILPFLGFIGLVGASGWIRCRLAGIVASTLIFISFLCFASLLYLYVERGVESQTFTFFDWIPVPGIQADVTVRLDHLSLLMSLIITGVGFLIHVYSIGYMDHEVDAGRYFALLNFFVFAMLILVLAENLLLLFVGWEGVGLASYLLIGYWYERPAAAQAATKAFALNRIGDFGLLIGLLLTFHAFGTGSMGAINERVGHEFAVGAPLITLITCLYFVGAMGKSAQLPLHVWLPDAMEGPTPVSALIHAATMVTAGVYLVVRMHALFLHAPETLHLIGIIGGATALFASLCAMSQSDLKRVLAYSTISQLGLMFLACGVGAFYAAMFHLTTHAFMKGLLFLSAGNVVHMMHGNTEMEKMGGLRKQFPYTHWFFLIGAFAMAGIPPFAAFFSKDLILEVEYLNGYKMLFYVGLIASILTAFYLVRAYCLTFLGKPHFQESPDPVKEAPAVMLLPVGVLAFLSIIGGFLGFSFGSLPLLEKFLGEVGITPLEVELTTTSLLTPETILSIIGGIVGMASAAYLYTRYLSHLKNPISLFKNGFYINEIYSKGIVQPFTGLATFIVSFLEPQVFSGMLQGIAGATQGVSQQLQKIQSGQIRSYAAWMVLGSVLLIVYFVL